MMSPSATFTFRTVTGTGSHSGRAGAVMNPHINLNDKPLECWDDLQFCNRGAGVGDSVPTHRDYCTP